MYRNQKGFSVVELIMIIVVISFLGMAGWLTYGSSRSDTDNNVAENAIKLDQPERLNIELRTTEDIKKLPTYTPDSFKVYLKNLLSQPNPCEAVYSIYAISDDRINGGVAIEGESCGSGAPLRWVQLPSGEWTEESVQ